MLGECLYCKSSYTKVRRERKYCCRECYRLAFNTTVRKKEMISKTLRDCLQCKKEAIFKYKYCSKKCQRKAFRERKKNRPSPLTPEIISLRDQLLQEVDPKVRFKLIKKITKEIRKSNA